MFQVEPSFNLRKNEIRKKFSLIARLDNEFDKFTGGKTTDDPVPIKKPRFCVQFSDSDEELPELEL